MLLSVAFAFAADLPLPAPEPSTSSFGYSGTALFPDARARKPMSLEITGAGYGGLLETNDMCMRTPGGGSGGCGPSFEPGGLAGGRLAWTIVADLRVEVQLGTSPGSGLIGAGSVSWSAPVSDVVRLGAWVGTAGSVWSDFNGVDAAFGGGASLSARWRTLSLDVSVPVFVINEPGEETPFYLPWALSEGSVSFAVGRGHSLRLGMLSLAPGVGWQYSAGHLIARADLHSLGVVTVARAELGARF